MNARRTSLAVCYVAMTAVFLTAAVLSRPSARPITMSSIAVGKSDRLNIGSPAAFVTERFAG